MPLARLQRKGGEIMGLDMYLSARQYISRIDFSKEGMQEAPAFREMVEASGMTGLVEPDGYAGVYVEVPVMQWRKANAIHNWFVTELGDGVDDCRPMGLGTDRLQDLVTLCEQVLEDNSKAEELLPTESGFFFGGTEYDEYYYGEIAQTADRLRYIVAEAEAKKIDELVYQASW